MAANAQSAEARKVVTIVFCDIVGSSELAGRLESEALARVMKLYFDRMRTIVEGHGGTVAKFIGDAVVAVFGIPLVREDDAIRAVRAAGEMKDALPALNEELKGNYLVELATRTGIHTGEVLVGASPGHSLALGDTMNLAARYEQAAVSGEILLSPSTARLVEGMVELGTRVSIQAKGVAGDLAAHPLVRAGRSHRTMRAAPGRHVGRDTELAALLGAQRLTVAAARPMVATVIGDAGIGKSRLLRELEDELGEQAAIVHGRCLSYGEGITFWPLLEIVREASQTVEGDPPDVVVDRLATRFAATGEPAFAARILAATVGLLPERPTDAETLTALRILMRSLAADRPLVVMLEDAHWADVELLDVIETVLRGLPDVPCLVVVAARPELDETRPHFGGHDSVRIYLAPLDPRQTDDLIADLVSSLETRTGISRAISEAAGGNPLFVSQLIATLIDDGGLLRTESGNELVMSGPVRLPDSIHALLSSRVDVLPPDERLVVEAASVAGLELPRAMLVSLLESVDDLEALVGSLQKRRILARAHDTDLVRFEHFLMREAAYDSVPRSRLADLHEQAAVWLETSSQSTGELDEIIAHHLEQCVLLRRTVAPGRRGSDALAVKASVMLREAASGATLQGLFGAAMNLYRRAVALVDEGSANHVRLLLEMSDSEAPDENALSTPMLAVAYAEALGDEVLRHRAAGRLVYLRAAFDTDASREATIQALEQHRIALESLDDDEGLVTICRQLANFLPDVGRSSEAVACRDAALEHARRVGDRRLTMTARMVLNYVWAPLHLDEVRRRLLDDLAQADTGLYLQARIHYSLAAVCAWQGDPTEFHQTLTSARRAVADIEAPTSVLDLESWSALAALDLGLFTEVIDSTRALLSRHMRFHASPGHLFVTTALADALSQTGEHEEALAAIEPAVPDWPLVTVRRLLIRARAAMSAHISDASVDYARRALSIATEIPDRLNAHEVLAMALRTSGRDRDARAVCEAGVVEAERLGHLAMNRRLSALLSPTDLSQGG